jgi:predicted enzyme related to lactoylglutathione lyase
MSPTRGALGYLQLPTTDVAASIAFYEAVLGWHGESAHASFEAPGLIGQWTTELAPSPAGPVPWFAVDDLFPTLTRVTDSGGTVRSDPVLDQGERWLVEVEDPSGNRLGLVAPAPTARSQTLLMVRDVEASSRWYQELLGLTSDHGGPDYERLLADGELVLQLHHEGTDHHHGPIGDAGQARGNGVLVWFGAVSDFDGVVERAEQLGADVVKAPHRNPPEGEGNGPGHREVWVKDPDGYVVAVASPDGEAWEAP